MSYSVEFKAHRELWNLLSKAVPGKLHVSCGHSKRNCLQDRANFHRFLAWQIVLISNPVITSCDSSTVKRGHSRSLQKDGGQVSGPYSVICSARQLSTKNCLKKAEAGTMIPHSNAATSRTWPGEEKHMLITEVIAKQCPYNHAITSLIRTGSVPMY